MGSLKAGGYVWHTTGSGKTLTSFKTAQLATSMPFIDKVLFVVDRKDLDYQTMREYDRFQKGAANSNTSTRILRRQLEDDNSKIIITTIQKLSVFIKSNKGHEVFQKHIVIIFDECHRSQFGDMHKAITKFFKKYHLFGFTGTPIFAVNAGSGGNPSLKTTPQAFGDQLHTYTIVDAINDGNVLPFHIDYINTMRMKDSLPDVEVSGINTEEALRDPARIREIVKYILEHFDQKTKRSSFYSLQGQRVAGFNSIFAVSSIPMAKLYYSEFKRQMQEGARKLTVATIFSFSPNEAQSDDVLPEEEFDTSGLDQTSRDFLDSAISDYNKTFSVNFDTSSDKFENYYKDISMRVKNREIDLLIVVNMFLTGFDATTLNTLWVDKNLRHHGLLQAFSRTNRILNSVKTYGNIVCFRNLQKETDASIALFGDKEAGSIVLLKRYEDYYYGYESEGTHTPGYIDLIDELLHKFPIGQPIQGEQSQKEFISLYGAILRLKNILTAFDTFEGNEILPDRDFQDYQSSYIDLYQALSGSKRAEKEKINDDIVFEIELIRQVEINIDYILMLVERYHQENCRDKDILVSIDKAVNSSIQLRSKKDLIQAFIEKVNMATNVKEDWQKFVEEQKDSELEDIIQEEKLKPEPTKRYIANSFRDGSLRTTGTDIDRIMPALSRFGAGNRGEKKQTVIQKLTRFFEKFFGIVS
jgi:type I restriction enzyme R subunit